MNPQQNPEEVLEQIELEKALVKIKNKVVVLSGKGGVGKSTVAANLAVSLSMKGQRVGLLDVDFHGPSIPKIVGLENVKVDNAPDGKLLPMKIGDSLKVMSLANLLPSNTDAVIWRGPMKMGALKQLIKDVVWEELDYLIFDCPPGTGDEPLSIIQLIPGATGAVVVTTPQDVAVSDVKRSINFCDKVNLKVLGVVENMSGFVCPHCSEVTDIFKSGGGEKMCAEMNVDFLGKVPMDPNVVQASDSGEPFVYHYSKTETAKIFEQIVEKFDANVAAVEKERAEASSIKPKDEKKDGQRRYALPYENGKVNPHFGSAQKFVLYDYDLEKKKVVKTFSKNPPALGHDAIPTWLKEFQVDVLLAVNMGTAAMDAVKGHGIEAVVGVPDLPPSELVEHHANGTLIIVDSAGCGCGHDHGDDHHHGDGGCGCGGGCH